MVTLTFDLITPKKIGFSPFHRGIMWPSLLKIQYTELKLSCRNNPVVKNSIYSNGDLDLGPNDPKINRVLPLPHGNHVAKFGKDPIYRTKVIVRKPVWTPACHTQSHNMSRRDGRIMILLQQPLALRPPTNLFECSASKTNGITYNLAKHRLIYPSTIFIQLIANCLSPFYLHIICL
jgi:hypothetical protein